MAGEWNRLTRHAKRAVLESQELAASLGSPVVQPAHLLTILLDDNSSSAVLLLCIAGAGLEEARSYLEESLSEEPAVETAVAKATFSPAVKAAVEQSGAMAGGSAIGTEHLLVSLLQGAGPLANALQSSSLLDPEELERHLAALADHELSSRGTGLAGSSGVGSPAPPAPISPAAAVPAAAVPGSAVAGSAPAGSAPAGSAPAGRSVRREAAPSGPTAPTVAEQPAGSYAGSGGGAPGGAAGGAASTAAGSAGGGISPHTVTAIARLVVDLAGKAAAAARESGSTAVAEHLDRMRGEIDAQLKSVVRSPKRAGE